MKTYKLDLLEKLKKYSPKFDSGVNFINHPWRIFDDTGKEIFVYFKDDSNVLLSENGSNVTGMWQFDALKSVLSMTFGQLSLNLTPSFSDNNIIVFAVDTTQNYLVVINSDFKTPLLTLEQLNSYLNFALNNIDPVIKAAVQKAELEKHDSIKAKIESIAEKCDSYPWKRNLWITIAVSFLLLISGILSYIYYKYYDSIGISLMILSVVIGAILYGFFDTQRWQTAIKNMVVWFKDNDETEIIEYLKKNKKLKLWFIENYDFDPTKIKRIPIPDV